MDNIFTAIMAKFSGSALSTALGGRMFSDFAPQDSELPYCVFFVVTSGPEDTFKDSIDDTMIQFSLYSGSSYVSEMTNLYGLLIALYDDAALTVTGDTLIWCKRERTATMVEVVDAGPGAITKLRHWAVDYSIKVQD